MEKHSNVAQQMREKLNSMGIISRQVSCRMERGGRTCTAMRCTIKDKSINIDLIRKVADEFEKIDRCLKSGDILEGGNIYIFVDYSFEN